MNAQRYVRNRRLGASRAQGFSLIELLVSLTVFVVIAGAVASTLMASTALNRVNKESLRAMEAAEGAIEELKGTTFSEIFARYNVDAVDDPALGASPGMYFAVDGLTLRSDDGDGFAGTIEFPGGGKELREDAQDAELGMPRDLNGDTETDDADHAADYRLLPVRVTVEWTGKTGNRELELMTVLSEL